MLIFSPDEKKKRKREEAEKKPDVSMKLTMQIHTRVASLLDIQFNYKDLSNYSSSFGPKKNNRVSAKLTDPNFFPYHRYQIYYARHVFGITFIRYTQNRKI